MTGKIKVTYTGGLWPSLGEKQPPSGSGGPDQNLLPGVNNPGPAFTWSFPQYSQAGLFNVPKGPQKYNAPPPYPTPSSKSKLATAPKKKPVAPRGGYTPAPASYAMAPPQPAMPGPEFNLLDILARYGGR